MRGQEIMAQQTISQEELLKKMASGETLKDIAGVTDTQFKALAVIGYNQYQQGRLKDAETMFLGLTALDKTNYIGFAGAGAVALARKPPDLDAAYKNLSKAAELRPEDGDIQANLGEVLLRQGKLKEATAHLEKAFQLDPDRKDPGVNRARAIVTGLDAIVKEAQKRKEAEMAKAS
jgi:Flp pilus assembly protein TadD